MLPGRAKISASGTSWIHFSAAVRSSDLPPFSFFFLLLSGLCDRLCILLSGTALRFLRPGSRRSSGRPAGSPCRFTMAPHADRQDLFAGTRRLLRQAGSSCRFTPAFPAGSPFGFQNVLRKCPGMQDCLWGIGGHLLQPWAGCTIFSHIELVSNFNKEHSL